MVRATNNNVFSTQGIGMDHECGPTDCPGDKAMTERVEPNSIVMTTSTVLK